MHKNAEIVRRGYQAFNTADVKTLTEMLDATSAWHTPGRTSIAGDRMGPDAILAQFGRYGQETGGTFKAELRTVTTDDEGRAIALHHNSGVRNGKRLDVDCCIVFQVKDGKMMDGREYFFDLHAWDAFWS
jgi:uncharacterized protein